MITRVEIENFQSHRHTVLDFVPGTNVIIGLSDSGKSSILRAILWVLTNRPRGDSFRSTWGGDTRVALHLSDGTVVERIKGSGKNLYVLNGEELKAFGADPPEEVKKILAMDEFNIQMQMDPPFLLSLSPGEAARVLNRAASLQAIDKTVSNLRKAYTEAQRNIDYAQGALQEYRQELAQFADLPRFEKSLDEIEKEMEVVREKKACIDRLSSLISSAKRAEEKLQQTRDVDSLIAQIMEIDSDRINVAVNAQKVSMLSDYIDRVLRIQEKLESMPGDDIYRTLESVETAWSRVQKATERIKALSDLTRRAQTALEGIEVAQGRIDVLEQEFEALSPDICPLCGNVMQGGVCNAEDTSQAVE